MQAVTPQSLQKSNPYAHKPFMRITVDITKGINAIALPSYSNPNIVYEALKPKMSEPIKRNGTSAPITINNHPKIFIQRGIRAFLACDLSLFVSCPFTTVSNCYSIKYNASVWGIFCVVEFWGKVAKPPQNGAKQKMSL